MTKHCTSHRLECAINQTKEPTIYFSHLSDVKPYNKICRYGERLYQLGWNIAIRDDPCLRCVCDERWDDRTPTDSLSCHRIDCEPQLQSKLRAGCRPIYSPEQCCPVDYHCREWSLRLKSTSIVSISNQWSHKAIPLLNLISPMNGLLESIMTIVGLLCFY